ncbi:hypothetical protein D6827_00930, partial [Candidatus Parcubacteria bacterium]
IELNNFSVIPGELVLKEIEDTKKKLENARKHPATKEPEYWEGYLAGINWMLKYGDSKKQ